MSTALQAGCSYVVTHDKGMKSVNGIRIIQFSEVFWRCNNRFVLSVATFWLAITRACKTLQSQCFYMLQPYFGECHCSQTHQVIILNVSSPACRSLAKYRWILFTKRKFNSFGLLFHSVISTR